MDLERGTEIAGRYTLERKIGHGGMGAVYLAHDAKFGEQVALKVAAAAGGAYEAFRNRFIREARIGNKLGRASGFVRAFDWGEFGNGFLYLGMDLINGARPLDLTSGSLEQRLQRFAVAAVLVGQAHSEGIVHRDLKPDNFLQATDGSLSLGDFGLAKLLGEDDEPGAQSPTAVHLTTSRMGMGTPRYMAPEQFEDAKNVDARADVYSLGVMLFLTLSGRWPFEGSSPFAFVSQHTRVRLGELDPPGPRDHVPGLPRSIDALCRAAIAIDPADRLASVEALVQGLEEALASAAKEETGPVGFVEAPSPGPPPPARDAPGRGPLEPSDSDSESGTPPAPKTPRKLVTPRWSPPGALPAGVTADFAERRFRAADGTLLVWVPPGRFRMGSKEPPATPEEAPLFQARLAAGFFMGERPVTWAQYRSFCAVSGLEAPSDLLSVESEPVRRAGPDHPVFNVGWLESSAYCQWAGGRLPTEAEWEYAARGKDGRVYPWGDEPPTSARCNWAGHPEHGRLGTCAVGSFSAGASPFGCLDMAGNVWEWVADWFGAYSRWVKTDPSGPAPPQGGGFKVARGGSWSTAADGCRTTARRMFDPVMRHTGIGFRLCVPGAS